MATRNEIQLLNLAYFGRPSDPAGLAGWESTGLTSSEIVLRFVETDEYQFNTVQPNEQGSTTDLTGLISTFYQRLFDRAPVQAEIDGWVSAINNGEVNLDYLGVTIANAGLNLTGSDLANTLNNKIEKANAFSDAVGADQTARERYSGWLAISIGQDFNSAIGETTTSAEAAVAQAAAFDRLPPSGVLIEVFTPNTEVAEGDSVGVQIQGFGPEAAGSTYDYVIIGSNGFGSSDLVDGSLTGSVTLDSVGNGLLQVDIKDDAVDAGESFTVQISAAPGLAVVTDEITITDTPAPPAPDPTLQVSSSNSAVDDGDQLFFAITSTELPAGTEVAWALAGISSADIDGAATSGTVFLDDDGEASVPFQISDEVSFDGALSVTFTAETAGLVAESVVVINNTDIPSTQSVLTTATDIVTNEAAAGFTIIATDETLGQNDQISSDVDGATLNIGTDGSFIISNFETSGVETFSLTPSDSFTEAGVIDMRNALGVTTLEINRSSLDDLKFDDIQSVAGLTAVIDDSFSDIEFNVDATALVGSEDTLDIVFSEAPIDAASGEALGLTVSQGPTDASADLETLNLVSTGTATTANVLDRLAVGPDLAQLNIAGDVDLQVEPDIGFPNRFITTIDASDLEANLFGDDLFTYSSAVDGTVTVRGAEGYNYLELNSSFTSLTDFEVFTQAGDDSIFTSSGDDFVGAAGGDNTVVTFAGDDVVITEFGEDSIVTGSGFDQIDSGAGDDTINSGADSDFVDAGFGDNQVFAESGDNTVISLEGDDFILAFDGNDSVNSGLGDDIVITGGGADTIVSLGGNNTIIAGVFTDPGNIQDEGADSVVTGGGSDTINSTGGSDTVRSGAGNDVVIEGNVGGGTIALDGDSNFIYLEEGDDELVKNIENLQSDDVIDGGAGIDTVTLTAGGVLRESETLQTSNIEAFDLVDGGNFDITLSNELISTSDNIVGNQRFFNVFTGDGFTPGLIDSAGNVTLDLTNIDPISEGLANEPLINSVRYFGQNDADTETVIVNDAIMSQFTTIAFGERAESPANTGDADVRHDVLVIQDTAEVTNSDLSNVSGLEVIELTATNNGFSEFVLDFSSMTRDDFRRLVGDLAEGDTDDRLLITATPSLNTAGASVLRLILPVDAAASAYVGARIDILESAELNVFVTNEVVGSEPTIDTALFFTPNADAFDIAGQTVVAYELNDVQPADRVTDVGAGDETIDFRFGLANNNLSLQEQLNDVRTDDVDIFDFNPGAINQAVEFDSLFGGTLGTADQTITGLDTISTAGGDDFMINIEQSLFVESFNGNDTITAIDNDGVSLTVVAGLGNDSVIGGGAADSLLGNEGADTLIGRSGADTILGGDGADSIRSGSGNDSVLGGEGSDSIFTDVGNDFVDAGEGNNTVDTDDGSDTVFAGSGNDSILSGNDDDTVSAGSGNNTVFAGLGADSVVTLGGADFINTAVAVEVDDDIVDSGSGIDTVLVGLGDDTVEAGAGNDLIVLASDIVAFSESTPSGDVVFLVNANDAGGFSADDRINGGDGFDTLAFTIDVEDATTTVTGEQVQNVEQFNVNVGAEDQTLVFDTSLLPLSSGGRLVVNIDADDPLSDGDGFVFDSTSFVQGEAIDLFTTGLDSFSSYQFGSGDDTFTNAIDESDDVTVAGNGGADVITLSELGATEEYVVFNTGNDGGVAGASTGGDIVNNFDVDQDFVIIATDSTGAPSPSPATGLLFDLTQAQAGDPAVLIGVENTVLTLGGTVTAAVTGLANNMLFLTGPAKSLTDAEITDAASVVQAINGVGVQGNGLAFGDDIGGGDTITQQTNQALIVQQGQTETAVWLYIESSFDFETAQAYTAQTDELRLLGTFDALLTDDDFITDSGTAVI